MTVSYIHRGFIHPWILKYNSPTTPVGIPLRAFSILIGLGQQIHTVTTTTDSRFTIGIVLFVAGFILNRYPDRFPHRSPLLSPANTDT